MIKKEPIRPMPEDAERVPYYFPFLWRDWRSNRTVKKMSPSDKGIFLELLVEQWMLDELNMDVDDLCRVTGARHDYMKAWLTKWGHRVLWCLDCKQQLTPEDVAAISAGVVEEQCGSSAEAGTEQVPRCQRAGKHQVRSSFNRKLRFLKFDVKNGLIPGTTNSEPIPIPRPNRTKPIFIPPTAGKNLSPVAEDTDFDVRFPGEPDPNCTQCNGRGNWLEDVPDSSPVTVSCPCTDEEG